VVLEPLEVDHQLVLLLHHALVVHLVEVALLAELVPRRLGLVRDLLHLVDGDLARDRVRVRVRVRVRLRVRVRVRVRVRLRRVRL